MGSQRAGEQGSPSSKMKAKLAEWKTPTSILPWLWDCAGCLASLGLRHPIFQIKKSPLAQRCHDDDNSSGMRTNTKPEGLWKGHLVNIIPSYPNTHSSPMHSPFQSTKCTHIP